MNLTPHSDDDDDDDDRLATAAASAEGLHIYLELEENKEWRGPVLALYILALIALARHFYGITFVVEGMERTADAFVRQGPRLPPSIAHAATTHSPLLTRRDPTEHGL